MKDKIYNLPTFPISIFLLPGGITRLRIFEPRYLKMVSLASDGSGFVIAPSLNSDKKEDRKGSWVEIINFGQGDDGVLEIDVKCKSLVSILPDYSDEVKRDATSVQYVAVKETVHWSQKKSTTELSTLATSLNDLFDNNDLLNELYDGNKDNNPYWLVARWLELLPIPFEVKNDFASHGSYREAKKLINSIIYSE